MKYQLFEDVARQFCIRNTETKMETITSSKINLVFDYINIPYKSFSSTYLPDDEYLEPYLIAEADSLEELKLCVPWLFL